MKPLFQKFLCKESLEINSRLSNNIVMLKRNIKALELNTKHMEKCIKAANESNMKDEVKACFIAKIEKDNNLGVKQTKWVICEQHHDLTLYIYDRPTLENYVLRMDLEYFPETQQIYLHEIEMSEENCSKGYGTLAMKYLFNLVNKLQIETIKGSQYFTSDKNKLRQNRFYTTFGFSLINGQISWKKED